MNDGRASLLSDHSRNGDTFTEQKPPL